MPTLPAEYCNVVRTFAPIFSKCIWYHRQVLWVGAILTPGKRTVTAVLRVMGLSAEPHFQTYHRILNRAVWYHSGQPAWPIRWVLIRDPQAKFRPQALVCTDLQADPVHILKWFVMRWQLDVTFREVREPLGVETQRQWSHRAILRTTPALLGLFWLVTLLAHQHARRRRLPIRQAAWYVKSTATFSDALALVRRSLWGHLISLPSPSRRESGKVSPAVLERFVDALSYTA